MKTKYEMIVWWSTEDAAFVVDIPELPGCMAHGKTRATAIRSAEQAIDLWVETAQALGRPIPVPRGRLMYA